MGTDKTGYCLGMSTHEDQNHFPEDENRDVTALDLETSRVPDSNSDSRGMSDSAEPQVDPVMSLFQTELAELDDEGSRISDHSLEEERKSELNTLINAGITRQSRKRNRKGIRSHESDSDGEENDWRSKAV